MSEDVDVRTTNWVDGYRRAWETNDPDDIRALFSEDAEYRTAPWREPWRGREAIVARWLEIKDEPQSTTFEWFPLTAVGDTAIVQGETVYLDGPGREDQRYSNLWVIRFDADGRAASFTEWWMDQSSPPESA